MSLRSAPAARGESDRENIARLVSLTPPALSTDEKQRLRAPALVRTTGGPPLLQQFFEPVVLGLGAELVADGAAAVGWTERERLKFGNRTPKWVARHHRLLAGNIGPGAATWIMDNARTLTHLLRHGSDGKYLSQSGSVANDQPIQSGKGTTITAGIAWQAAVGYRLFPVLAGTTNGLRDQLQCELEVVYGNSWQQFEGRKPGKGRPQVLWLTMNNSKAARQLTESKAGKEVDWDVHKVVEMMPDSSDSLTAGEETDFSWLQDRLASLDGSDDTIVIAVVKKDQPNLAPLIDFLQRHPNLTSLPTVIHTDEADQTNVQDIERAYASPDSVPSLLSDLRKSFKDAGLVQHSATTQALRLMNRTQHDQADYDLFTDQYWPTDLEPGSTSYVGLPEMFPEGGHPAVRQMAPKDWVIYDEDKESSSGKPKLGIPESAKQFIPCGREVRQHLEELRAQERQYLNQPLGCDLPEHNVFKSDLRDAQMGFLEKMRTNQLPAPYKDIPDSIYEALIEFVLTGAIRNLRQHAAEDWDYSRHAGFINSIYAKPGSHSLESLSINSQEGLGCIASPSRWQEMELHELISQLPGDKPDYMEKLRKAAAQLSSECTRTVPYETDVLKDAFGCLRDLGLEEELELDQADQIAKMAGVKILETSGALVMQAVSEALQKMSTPVRIVLRCLGIQTTSEPTSAGVRCRVVIRKEFDLGKPDAHDIRYVHVLLRDGPEDRFAKPVLLVPLAVDLELELKATNFVTPPTDPIWHAAMFNMTSYRDEQQKLADVIQQAWVIVCAFIMSHVDVTAESVEAIAAQLDPPLSAENLRFAMERCTCSTNKLKVLFGECWQRLSIRSCAANPSAEHMELQQVLPFAFKICKSAKIGILNSGADNDDRWMPSLNYSAGIVPTNLIAIGGYKLSRGLAIKGLIVSLLANGAKDVVQDALTQLLRLLGHRGLDRDLMCIHMPERLHSLYITCADVYTKDRKGLRDFVARRLNGEDPPLPEVAAHASLKPTNPSKMRDASIIERENQTLFDAPRLDGDAARSNYDAALWLLAYLHETTPLNEYEPCGSGFSRGEFLVFLGVDYDYVINFVSELQAQDPETAKNFADTLEVRKQLNGQLNMAFCRGAYDPSWANAAIGYPACVTEDLSTLVCRAARKVAQPTVFRLQAYANFKNRVPDAVCDVDGETVKEQREQDGEVVEQYRFVPGKHSQSWFPEPSPGADEGGSDNRRYLKRTPAAPALLVMHLADPYWKDHDSGSLSHDHVHAAAVPVPLLRLFPAETGRQVLTRSDKPFSPLSIERVYAYLRVLQKLMEQGRLFIRNPFIRQITEENEGELGLSDGKPYLEVIGGEQYSVSLSSIDNRLRLTLQRLQADPIASSEPSAAAAADAWEADFGEDEHIIPDDAGLLPYAHWNEVQRSFNTLKHNVNRFYTKSQPEYKFMQHLNKLWKAEIAQKSGKPKPQMLQPKDWDRDLPKLLLHWAASDDRSLFPTGYPSFLKHHLLGVANGVAKHLCAQEDSDADAMLTDLVNEVLIELRRLACTCTPAHPVSGVGSEAVRLLQRLQPALHERGLCSQAAPEAPSAETRKELEEQAVIVVPPGRQKIPAKQAPGAKKQPVTTWFADRLCSPEETQHQCSKKRAELVAKIRQFSAKQGGRAVSATDSTAAGHSKAH